ncbi:MAG: DUF2244 domain-containing protein [Pseudomonadota bacterium]
MSLHTTLEPDARAPRLDLVLYPNPPLGRYGMVWVMGVAATVVAILGLGFWWLGAWPVTGLLGLDLLALGLALRITARRARRSELIRLDASGLEVRRLGPDGAILQAIALDPYWVRVELDERRLHDPQLALRSHGQRVLIGTFLAPAERRTLADTLNAALAGHRAQHR